MGLDKTTYSDLYAVIKEYFGGDGSRNFYLPDFRGYFLRGVDPRETDGDSSKNLQSKDPDNASRTVPRPEALVKGNSGPKIGSIQSHLFAEHTHSYFYFPKEYHSDNGTGKHFVTNDVENLETEASGGEETRPINLAFYFLIKVK